MNKNTYVTKFFEFTDKIVKKKEMKYSFRLRSQ